MILIIKHIGIEGPGTIQEFLRNTAWNIREIDFKVIDLSKEDKLPDSLEGIDAIITLGGPMNVYEEDKYPFLKVEDVFLKEAIKEEVPVLGICLGAQLLAKACRAKVKKAASKEIGWYRVDLTDNAKSDPLFKNLPSQLAVFQWHEDTFEIPQKGVLLAESATCSNQAFKFGRNAYGFQFHIEVNPEIIESWIKEYIKEGDRNIEAKDMIIEAYKKKAAFEKQANLIFLNFLSVVKSSIASRRAG